MASKRKPSAAVAKAGALVAVEAPPASAALIRSFDLELVSGDRRLFYKMSRCDRDEPKSYEMVEYSWGTFGTAGKSHLKFFNDDVSADDDTVVFKSGATKADEFITLKRDELVAKGYAERGSAAPFRPVTRAGESVYLERKDIQLDERSFYQLMLDAADGTTVHTSEGDIGGQGRAYVHACASVDEALAYIAAKVLEMGARGYKKKKQAPPRIAAKFDNGWSDDSDAEREKALEHDFDSDSDDERPKRRKKAAKAKQRANADSD